MKPYSQIILSGCIGMAIGVSLNLYQWESSKTTPDQNTVAFVGAAVHNAKKDFVENNDPELTPEWQPSSNSEWYPNPDRPLHPQLAIFATNEPEKAAAIALSIPCPEEDPEANDPLRTVLKVWAHDNPDVAESFVNEITDFQRKLGATLGLIEGFAEHDIELSAKWVEKNIKHPDAVAFISLVVPYMEPKRAERWVASLPLDTKARELTRGLVYSRPRIIETR